MRKMFFVYSYFSIFFVIFVESYEEGPGGKYHKQQFYEYHYEFPDSSSNKKPKLTLTYGSPGNLTTFETEMDPAFIQNNELIQVQKNPREIHPKLPKAMGTTLLNNLPPFPFGSYENNYDSKIKSHRRKKHRRPAKFIEEQTTLAPDATWPRLPKHARRHLTPFSSSGPWKSDMDTRNEDDYATHSNVRYHPRKNRYHIDDYSPNETEMDFEMKPLDGMGPPNFGVSDMQNTFMSFMKQFPFSRIFDDMGGFSPMDIRRRPRSRASTQHSPIHVHFHDHSGKYRMGVENTPKPIEPLDEEEEDAFVV